MATLCRLDVFLLFTFQNIISNSRYNAKSRNARHRLRLLALQVWGSKQKYYSLAAAPLQRRFVLSTIVCCGASIVAHFARKVRGTNIQRTWSALQSRVFKIQKNICAVLSKIASGKACTHDKRTKREKERPERAVSSQPRATPWVSTYKRLRPYRQGVQN